MGHNNHWNRASAPRFEHLTNALCIIAATVHNLFAANVAFFGFHDPFIAIALDANNGTETFDTATCVTGTLGQCLGQLCRINITIQRIPKTTHQIMGFHERVQLFQFRGCANVHLQTLITAHTCNAFEFLHPLF